MRNVLSVLCVALIGLLAMPAMSQAAASPPFTDDFETGTIGADYSTEETGEVQAQTEVVMPVGGGTYSVMVSNDAITLSVAAGTDNAWCQVYTKAAGYEGEPPETDLAGATAAFYVQRTSPTTGQIRGWDGDGAGGGSWSDLGAVSLSAGLTPWIGFVVHLDYANDEWDLYLDSAVTAGEPPGMATLTRLNTDPLGFYEDSTELTTAEVSSELAAYIDEIALQTGNNPVPGDHRSMYSSIKSRFEDHALNEWHGIVVPANSCADDSLNGPLGGALAMGLANNDQLRLWTDNGWEVYSWDGNWQAAPGPTLPGSVSLAVGQTTWLEYYTASLDTPKFFPAGMVPDDTNPPVETSNDELYGLSDPSGGWTHVIFDAGGSPQLNDSGLRTEVPAGSLAFIAAPGSNAYRRYYMVGGLFYYDGEPANLSLRQGMKLWVFNNQNDRSAWPH